jgi:hypothetical protein
LFRRKASFSLATKAQPLPEDVPPDGAGALTGGASPRGGAALSAASPLLLPPQPASNTATDEKSKYADFILFVLSEFLLKPNGLPPGLACPDQILGFFARPMCLQLFSFGEQWQPNRPN